MLGMQTQARADDDALRRWSYQSWSAEAGLPQLSVNHMQYGSDRRLWIATENGLARFDGGDFDVFRRDQVAALGSNWITRLQTGVAGEVWIGTKRNLARFSNGEFEAFELPETGPVVALALDREGVLLVGGSGLFRQSGDGFTVDARWTGPVGSLLGIEGGVWVAAPTGRLELHRGTTSVRINVPDSLIINALAVDPGDPASPWIGSNLGLHRVNGSELANVVIDQRMSEINALAVDQHGALWIASRDRLIRRSRQGAIELVTENDPRSFPWVVSLLNDDDGMWLGSHQHGMRYTWPNENHAYSVADGLGSAQVWTMVNYQGQLLVGNKANQRLHGMNQELVTASITDSLTGLHNRRNLKDRIEPLLERLSNTKHDQVEPVMGLILIDIDHFKRINDAYGHAVGDAVLVAVASAIGAATDADDLRLRWGGEEFLVVKPLTSMRELSVQAERVRKAIEAVAVEPLAGGEVCASVGYTGHAISNAAATFLDWQKALSLADYALYGAKTAGRNRGAAIELLDPDLFNSELALSAEQIRDWIAQGQARLHLHDDFVVSSTPADKQR